MATKAGIIRIRTTVILFAVVMARAKNCRAVDSLAPTNSTFALAVYMARRPQAVLRTPKAFRADADALQSACQFLRGLMPVVTQQRRICVGLQRILQSFFG